jgi:hypothetical protein
MPDFLAAFPAVSHLPYLPDVARLELALRHAYHAADAAPVDPMELQSLEPDALLSVRIGFAPAVGLLQSEWPILSIWLANTQSAAPPTNWRGEDILVTRPEFDPVPRLLPRGAAAFVGALQSGATLGQAHDAAAPFDLTATLSLLLTSGAVATIQTA